MNHLFRRVTKLEHDDVIVGRMSPMARFMAAWDESARRLTGRRYESIVGDKALVERTLDDLATWYIPKLSNADLATLIAEFEGRFSEDDLATLKAQFAERQRSGHMEEQDRALGRSA